MVLVLRTELRLSPGKAAVQVAHAAVMLVQRAAQRDRDTLDRWAEGGQKKIALSIATLEELEKVYRRARARGIPAVVVEDSGLTEVPPGTRTCLGLGPAPSVSLDELTGSLPLL